MTDTAESLPLHINATGRVYDRWPGDSWREAVLADLITEIQAEALADIMEIVPRWQAAEKMALMFGWAPAIPTESSRSKALAELWMRWVQQVPDGFLNADVHPELISQIADLAQSFTARQSTKVSTPAPQKLILPT